MEKHEYHQFSAMLHRIADQYSKPVSPELTMLYFDSLRHLSLNDVRGALKAHVLDTDIGQYMPKIADIVRQIEGSKKAGAEVQAQRALARLNQAITGFDLPDDDQILLAVVRDMGGMRSLGQMDQQDWLAFGTKEFLKKYTIYAQRPVLLTDPRLTDNEAMALVGELTKQLTTR